MATATYLETLSFKPWARTDDIFRQSARQALAKIADCIGEETKRKKTCGAFIS